MGLTPDGPTLRARPCPAGARRYTEAVWWRSLRQYALIWGIRLTPLPWRAKEWLIWWLAPRVLVVGLALIPDAHGRLLLVHARYSGRWIFPGGYLHPGEAPLDGLRRECREELGHDVNVRALAGFGTERSPGVLFILYHCAPLSGPPRLSPEHDAYRYVARTALPTRLRRLTQHMLDLPPT